MAAIRHQVWINAPRTKVYELLSTAEGVSQWWDQQTETIESGAIFWEHNPGPEHGIVRMRVLEREPGRRVEWECVSQHKSETPASAWTGTRCRFEVFDRTEIDIANQEWSKAVPAQTVLSFEHSGWSDTSQYLAFCNFAWASVLQKLAEVAEGSAQK